MINENRWNNINQTQFAHLIKENIDMFANSGEYWKFS